MKSSNFVVLGDFSIASDLGKKGQTTDITMYERKTPNNIMTFVVPSGFPEKIQPLLQSIALADAAILNISNIEKSLGEQIVALDEMGMKRGFIVTSLGDAIKPFIKDTVIENYQTVSKEELLTNLDSFDAGESNGPSKVVVDAAFEVKGVGTVALGVVKRGEVKKYDELTIFPDSQKVTVRSIQMHDDDVDSVKYPGRLGLALKGTSADRIEKGSIIGPDGSVKSSKDIRSSFRKNRFYRDDLKSGTTYHACIGIQIKPVKLSIESETASIQTEKPMAFESGDRCVILDLDSKSNRIVGSGSVL